jgi:hypothetical protein
MLDPSGTLPPDPHLCPACGQVDPGDPGEHGWADDTPSSPPTAYPAPHLRPPPAGPRPRPTGSRPSPAHRALIVARRALVAGHTAATIWLLWTRQVQLAVTDSEWLGPGVAAACTLIALFISATAIRGRWWPWVWALAGWVAPVVAYHADTMWPVYLSVAILPATALWVARKNRVPLRVHAWLFADFHPIDAVRAAAGKPQAGYTLYRHFDAAGNLLYVGKTIRPAWRRTSEHAKEKDWWQEVTTTTYARYASEAELSRAEISAIRREHPLHNIAHSRR